MLTSPLEDGEEGGVEGNGGAERERERHGEISPGAEVKTSALQNRDGDAVCP